jgi:hypothetical protein
MDKAQKLSDSECYTSLLEPFRIKTYDLYYSGILFLT